MHDGGGGGFGGHDGGFGGGHHGGGIGGGHDGGGLGGVHHHHHSTDDGSGQIPQYGVAPIRLQGGPGGSGPTPMKVRYISAAVFVALLIVALVLMH